MEQNIIYKCIHLKLDSQVNCSRLMKKKDILLYLGRDLRIPKVMRPLIIKEMESIGIIKNLNRDMVIVNPIEKDFEKDAKDIALSFGIY